MPPNFCVVDSPLYRGNGRSFPRVIECEILGGKYAGNMVMIPQIPLSPSSTEDLPFDFRRTQFPLRLAFAMTINKAQGQTLNYVGLCLKEPVFMHGQLYVALSRVTDGANLRMIVPVFQIPRRRVKER